MFNNIFFIYKDKSNRMNVSKICIVTNCEEFIKSKLSDNEISAIKINIIGFYIKLLSQIKSRFDFYREDLQLLNIVTPNNVFREQNEEI